MEMKIKRKDKIYTIIFDDEDYNLINQYHWFIDSWGYCVANKNYKTIYMHRLILEHNNVDITDKEIDHINRNKLDNRKENLKTCSRYENSINRDIFKNNKSGYKGICWSKKYNKWRVYITVNKKQIHLGYFNDKEKAINCRRNAEIKYFGKEG